MDQAPEIEADWRDRLLEAVVEGRLTPHDRREIEHRLDTAARPARRTAVVAEIEVLLRFLAIGARIRMEVGGLGRRPVDLEVDLEDRLFAVHVKRLPASPEAMGAGPPEIARRLAGIPRPYVVGVDRRIEGELDEETVEDARRFVLGSRVGDRHVMRNAEGDVVGYLDVLAPRLVESGDRSDRTTVFVRRGDAVAFDRQIDRAGRLLRRAYRQFAPSMENVIVIAGGGDAAGEAIDRATLGNHVERWDRLPRQGQRVAHGRDDVGLWTGRHYERSRLVGWAPYGGVEGRCWSREAPSADPRVLSLLRRALRITDER
ncbi:MAG: hypothetical protein VX726_11730 [Planctomycetota bacterium]|nr:hypothetical protein [Planctomycetota bacterium]